MRLRWLPASRLAPRWLSVLGLVVPVAVACSSNPTQSDGGPDAQMVEAGADADGSAPGDPVLHPNTPPKVTECNQPPITPPASGTCSVTAGTTGKLFKGTVLEPNEVLHRGEVLIDDAGLIVCSSCDCSAAPDYAQATIVACADGVISPGLVNPHDHLTYDNNPPVGHGTERYEHRLEWLLGLNGHTSLNYKSNASTAVQLFTELRFVMGGATSLAGAGGKKGLARDLDSNDSTLFEGLPVQTANSDTWPLDDTSGLLLTSGCSYGSGRTTHATALQSLAYLPHLAEGIGLGAHNELLCTNDSSTQYDLMEPPTAIVHGIAALPSDVAPLRADGTRLIWSPRSNIDLYGNTAPVTMFDALGVPIALGTDWVPSGSMNILRELKCADSLNQKYYGKHFTDADLWRMTTYNAAWAAGGAGVIGALLPGYVADIAIFDGATSKDHRAVIDAGVEDVVLVLRGGKVLYGDDALVADPAIGGQACETLDTCGRAKRACVAQDVGGTTTLASLRTAGEVNYPLFFCKTDVPTNEPSCVPYRDTYQAGITSTDGDGDGIDDASDDCPTIFNPVRPMDNGVQSDADGDGVGDACDRCPNDASNTCQSLSADDVDGDGVPNGVDVCPTVADPQQADSDGDGRGDACDTCPSVKNPGATPCALSIEEMRDPQSAKHPRYGAVVSLAAAYVTAVSANGFALQDISLLPFSGVWVDPGSAVPGLKRGNQVTVTGVYINPFGQAEVQASSVSIVDTGTALPFSAIATTPADIKTGGPKADAYQSMLVVLANPTITNDKPNGTSQFFEFVVDNGCRVDDFLYPKYGTSGTAYPPAGYTNTSTFSALYGVLGFSFSDSKLWPRDAADIVP